MPSTPPLDLAVTAMKRLIEWRTDDRVYGIDTDYGYARLQSLRDLADEIETLTKRVAEVTR
ncbi:MAG: hypothetical protein M0Z51_11165 [Propionibacterium sp.]|nr:hypothetical protein [Propionibacterium sp.]